MNYMLSAPVRQTIATTEAFSELSPELAKSLQAKSTSIHTRPPSSLPFFPMRPWLTCFVGDFTVACASNCEILPANRVPGRILVNSSVYVRWQAYDTFGNPIPEGGETFVAKLSCLNRLTPNIPLDNAIVHASFNWTDPVVIDNRDGVYFSSIPCPCRFRLR